MAYEKTTDRLRRILVLVPWIMAHPGASLAELSERFNVTRAELTADLEMVFCCGLPPFGPGDLIDVSIEGDAVTIDAADYLARPPRLSRHELLALLVTGRAIASLEGFAESASLRSALEKLERAVAPGESHDARDALRRIEVELSSAGMDALADLRAAVDERARLHIVYYSHGRGEMSERDIDPLILFHADADWYVAALDHSSGEERIFRVDRIKEHSRTGLTFERPPDFDAERYDRGALFTPGAGDTEAAIDVSPAAAWIREFVPHDSEEDLGDGWTRVHLRTPNLDWLVRLILSAGVGARAAAPPELAGAVRDRARRALSLYA